MVFTVLINTWGILFINKSSAGLQLMLKKYQLHYNQDTEDGDADKDYQDLKLNHQITNHSKIQDVWAENFEQNLQQIASLAKTYKIISFDTEFPGVVVQNHHHSQFYENSSSASNSSMYIHQLKPSVEQTKLIQFGITLSDSLSSTSLKTVKTWQFHMRFDLEKEKYVQQSIQILKKAGIDFNKLKKDGISFELFSEKMMESGLVLNKSLKWIVFHGNYDICYMLHHIRNQKLPQSLQELQKVTKLYFPKVYDLKYIIQSIPDLKYAGLSGLAQVLNCERVGPMHQAGSDSLLTVQCYDELQKTIGSGLIEDCCGRVYGLESEERSDLCLEWGGWKGSSVGHGPLYSYLYSKHTHDPCSQQISNPNE